MSNTATQLLFIDAAIKDVDALLVSVAPGVEVVRLQADRDGLVQIAEAMAGRTGVEAVHIISHGSAGRLELGDAVIDEAALAGRAAVLGTIRDALSAQADLLLYGCDVAAGDAGASFLGALAAATGADVAASTDMTGPALSGGDWTLEAATGAIEAATLAPEGWDGVLGADSQIPGGLISGPPYTWNGYTFQTRYEGSIDNSDPDNALRAGSKWDRYALSGVTPGTTVYVYMGNSSTVDDFIQIERNGTVIVQDDDAGDGERSYDSFLSWTYQAGDIIRATTYASTNRGSYSLYVGTSSGTTTTVTDIGSAPPPTNYAPTFTGGTGTQGTVTDTAANDSFSALTGTVTATDTADGTSDTVSYSVLNGSGTYGTLSIQSGTGAWTFTPNNAAVQGLTGSATQSFTVRASDGVNNTDATISFSIQGANDAITAVADTATATEARGIGNATAGTQPSGNVLGNDADRDSGDSRSVVALAGGSVGVALAGSHGTLTLNADGTYAYAVNNASAAVNALRSGQTLTDTFTYTARDGGGHTSSATLTITIQGANDNPTAANDTATATEQGSAEAGSQATGSVLDNDSDAESEALTVTAYTMAGSYGTLTLHADGTYAYAVNNSLPSVQALRTASDTLADSFSYTVRDASGAATPATLTITLRGANDNPLATDDAGTAIEAGGTANGTPGRQASGSVLLNDSDVDAGDTRTVTSVRTGGLEGAGASAAAGTSLAGSHGTLTLHADGSYTYVVDESDPVVQALQQGQSLTDSFNYTVADTAGGTDLARLDITVQGRNDAPVFVSAPASIGFDDTAGPDAGTLAAQSGSVAGTDVDSAGVRYDVRGGTLAGSGAAQTSSVTGLYGTLTITTATGAWIFTPNAVAIDALPGGADLGETFEFRVTDTQGASALQSLLVQIRHVNDTPVQAAALPDQTYTGGIWSYQVPAESFTDAEGGGFTYSARWVQADGTPVGSGDLPAWLHFDAATRTFSGTPAVRTDIHLQVVATDAGGLSVSDIFRLDLTNDAPTGSATATLDAGTEDTAYVVSAATLLQGYADPDGDPLSVSDLTADFGTVEVLNGGAAFRITPAANHTGPVVLSYDVTDGQGGATAASRTFTLAAVNDAPAGSPSATLPSSPRDTVVVIAEADLVAGHTDAEGGALSVAGLSASPASVERVVDGVTGAVSFRITPQAGHTGPVTLDYRVVDAQGGSTAATQSFQVTAVNHAPTLTGARTALAGGTEDTGYALSLADLLQGITDADGDTLSIASISADHGTVSGPVAGVYTVTPSADHTGPVVVSYTVTDGTATLAATRTFTLAAVNDAPSGAASATLAAAVEDRAVVIGRADLLRGFTDAEGDVLSVSGLAATRPDGSSAGTLATNPDGSWTFTPAANYHGQVNLSYTVSDGRGGSAAGALSFAVTAVNDAPTASGMTQTIGFAEDAGWVDLGDIVVADTDGENVTATLIVDNPAAGVLTTSGAATYDAVSGIWTVTGTAAQVNAALAAASFTPAANWASDVVITTMVRDGSGASPAAGTITLQATAGNNDAPRSTADHRTVAVNTEAVLGRDDFGAYSDPEGSALAQVRITELPTNGSLQYHNGTSWVAVTANQVITAGDIDAGHLKFVAPTSGTLNAGYANVRFQV
ncbi:MAG: hypothetical protein RL456_2238, partial [Pseudomonadota bacterium]